MAGQASGVRTYSSSGGVSIVADVDGPDDAPVVLLMHGGGQTRHSWSGAMASLVERGYRVVNYDARGHGDSSWAEDGAYALDDRVDDVRAVLGDTTAPFALVGASLGGATAIHAVASGLAASAVVMVDIVPDPEPLGIGRITDFMNGHLDGFADLDEAADAVAAYNPERPRPTNPTGLMRNLRRRDNGRLYWHWDPRILKDPTGQKAIIRRSAEAAAAAAEPPPFLLVRGLHSDVVSDAGVASFRALMSDLEVVDVAGAGHMVAGDRNDAFNAGVIDLSHAKDAGGAVSMSVDLSGRVALVTGASAGLGRYFALTLARAGAAVVLCARRLEVLEDLAEDIRAEGGRALPLALDLSDASAMAGAFDAAEAAYGTVDILVNNAGVADGKYATRMTLEEVDHVLAINVRAPFLMATEAARRLMAAEMPGRIVNLSSVAAYTYTHKSAAALYATTKAAVVKMTEALAIEWSAQKINVNAIAPGLFRSEMSAGYIERAGDFTGRFPRGRVGEPEFLESTLLYLVDPASSFVTGTTIIVDDAQQGR